MLLLDDVVRLMKCGSESGNDWCELWKWYFADDVMGGWWSEVNVVVGWCRGVDEAKLWLADVVMNVVLVGWCDVVGLVRCWCGDVDAVSVDVGWCGRECVRPMWWGWWSEVMIDLCNGERVKWICCLSMGVSEVVMGWCDVLGRCGVMSECW